MMTSVRALACGLLVASTSPFVDAVAQSEPISVQLSSFRAVELRNGGRVTLRAGPTQRVTFLKGSPDQTQIAVSRDRLVIDKCGGKCTRRYELEIEIITPELTGLTVAHGGTIQSQGNFPRQAGITVNVDNGGTIDVRSMSVESVAASVLSGGRIYVKPLTGMIASVVDGGNITHWGNAPVKSSIEHGGVVQNGIASEVDYPLSELSP